MGVFKGFLSRAMHICSENYLGGYSKSTFVVQEGGFLKSELKRTGGGGWGVKPTCTFALWKKLPDFQTAGRVFDKLLGSC